MAAECAVQMAPEANSSFKSDRPTWQKQKSIVVTGKTCLLKKKADETLDSTFIVTK